jgi:hypothetical protein
LGNPESGLDDFLTSLSLIQGRSLQNRNAWQDKFSGTTVREPNNEEINVKMTRAWLAAMIGAGLASSAAAQVKGQPGEMVQVKSLPASVQQTINQKAAGGEVVRVKREDDTNGKWNYEVVVKSQGKEWGFEVDPNGKLLKTHGEKR